MNKKQTQPLVSVIMPVYNAKAYINDAIESILRQTYSNLEFIIVDDHSTDGTQKILEHYKKKDARIILIRPTKKSYLSGCLNTALQKAKGTYIARMDADDVSLPERLEKQVQYLETHKQTVAVGCQEDIINESGDVVADKFFPQDPKDAYNTIMNFMVIQPPTLMARAKIMKKLKYDTGIAKHDDIDMHFQLLQYGSFATIPDIAFQYRVSPHSYTHRNAREVFFMALTIRIRAILKYGYRPPLQRIFLAALQAGIVAFTPEQYLVPLFESIRYTKTIKIHQLPKLAYDVLFRTI